MSGRWDEFWAGVGSEEWLAAKAILEADTRLTVGRDFAQYLDEADPWDAWIASVKKDGRGWSSTEWRQYRIVAALVDYEEVLNLQLLSELGSWEGPILAALVSYASGGNNRDLSGRCAVVRRAEVRA